jgi:hypothetical protein
MTGMLWQCGCCDLSFVNKNFLDAHLKYKNHHREFFEIPDNWVTHYVNPPQEIYIVEELMSLVRPSKRRRFLQNQRIYSNDSDDVNTKDDDYVQPSDDDNGDTSATSESESESDEDGDDEQMMKNKTKRRKAIYSALVGEEEDMSNAPILFEESPDDKKWSMSVWRPWIDKQTQKFNRHGEERSKEVREAMEAGTEIPDLYKREVSQTIQNCQYGLKFVAQFYQVEANKTKGADFGKLVYKDWFDFGNPKRHVCLLSAKDYLDNGWKNASPYMKNHFIYTHVMLRRMLREHCLSADGLAKFNQLFGDDPLAQTKAIEARHQYLNTLRDLADLEKDQKLHQRAKDQAEQKQIKEEKRRTILWGKKYGTFKSEDIQMKIKQFLESETTKEAQDIVVLQATNDSSNKLPRDSWVKATRNLVLSIQSTHSGRTELSDMTMGEWHGRQVERDALVYTVIVERHWTKTGWSKTHQSFLSLNVTFEALCILYEKCRKVQFPNKYDGVSEEEQSKQSFFLNSTGNSYFRAKSGVDGEHMIQWNNATGRKDTPKMFRKLLANFSLNTDEVTRVNIAFVNQHTKETMLKVYTAMSEKCKAGVNVLQTYRDKALNIDTEIKTTEGDSITVAPTKESALAQLSIWKRSIKEKLEEERKLDAANDAKEMEHFGSSESRSSLVELCAAEVQTGRPVGEYYIADLLLRKDEKRINKKPMIYHEILRVIDSKRFSNCQPSISLSKTMVRVARINQVEIIDDDKTEESIDYIETECCARWKKQLDKISRIGVPIGSMRIPYAIMCMQEALGEKHYSMGNIPLQANIDHMMSQKRGLEVKVEENIEGKVEMLPEEIVLLSRLQKSPMESGKSPLERRKLIAEEIKKMKKKKGAAKKLVFND